MAPSYTILGENGSIEPGNRLMNLVWYYDVTDAHLVDIVTDTSGHRHNFALRIGKMCPEIWAEQCAHARKVLPAPLAVLVSRIASPFITAVTSIASPRAVFLDGKLPLVGSSTNQAALDALLLEKAFKGEIGLDQWEEQVMEYVDLTRLKSIVFESFYMDGYPAIIADVSRCLWMFGIQRLSRLWYESAYPFLRSKFNLL